MNSSLIVSYGMPKSASTFAWMLFKDLIDFSEYDVATLSSTAKNNHSKEDYLTGVDADQLQNILREASGKYLVVKTHSKYENFSSLLNVYGKRFVFLQYRDPREISLSLIDHGNRSRELGSNDFAQCIDVPSTFPVIDHAVTCLKSWMQISRYMAFSYDELCFDTENTIDKFLDKVRIKTNKNLVIDKYKDKGKIIQFNKGLKDRWREELSIQQAAEIRDRYSEFYVNDKFTIPM